VTIYRAESPDTARAVVHEDDGGGSPEEWTDYPVHPGTYEYWIRARLFGGLMSPLEGPVEEATALPDRPLLGKPFPNPASHGSISIAIAWPDGTRPSIEIHDASGRRIRTLTSTTAGPGFPRIDWDLRGEDGRPVATGLYFARAGKAGTARMIVLR
jgi:hypothetical protein